MKFIIGGILLIIVIAIIALIVRKKMFDSVDDYEDWKVDIINRNVAAELARVRGLNLQGETKKQFESWKEQWDIIITRDLATVEELLYDAESATESFRFAATKKSLNQINSVLTEVEEKLEVIMSDLNGLINTEATNRTTVENIAPTLAGLRKHLSQNRFKFDSADVRFESVFNELDKQLIRYEEVVVEGNYEQAKEILTALNLSMSNLQIEMDEFPDLYKACKQTLPSKLDDLYQGLQDMKAQGYPVQHLRFDKEISDYQTRLIDCVLSLENKGTAVAKEVIPNIEERINEMYDLLENEALAKNYIQSKMPSYRQELEEFQIEFLNTKTEVENLKRTYHFEDSELERYFALEKMISKLKVDLTVLIENIEKNANPNSRNRMELEEGFAELAEIEKEHEIFKLSIQNLRKDEIEAQEQLQLIHSDIYETHRKLRNSNIPGVPNFIWTIIDEANDKNEHVLTILNKQPLDVSEVQQALSDARSTVEHAVDQTNIMLEQAHLTEQVIQYANRYRSSNPILAASLLESERYFRSGDYELALEQAAAAIEEVEPGALKRIEKIQEDPV